MMRKLRLGEAKSFAKVAELERSKCLNQRPCSYLTHHISQRSGISKAKLRKDDIEAAQPPSSSCSALPFPLPLPCRSLVYLQAFALEAAMG